MYKTKTILYLTIKKKVMRSNQGVYIIYINISTLVVIHQHRRVQLYRDRRWREEMAMQPTLHYSMLFKIFFFKRYLFHINIIDLLLISIIKPQANAWNCVSVFVATNSALHSFTVLVCYAPLKFIPQNIKYLKEKEPHGNGPDHCCVAPVKPKSERCRAHA